MTSTKNVITKVGIGASAGGLEAIQKLVRNLDEENGYAYFIVMHLAPDKESNLVDIIKRAAKIPVVLAENDMEIKKDHIYVIPPNKYMSTSNDYLKIEPFKSKSRPHLTINYFLESLANETLERSIGIILSGTGSDGSLGLRAIKEHGGITFAQSEESAQYSEMPSQAAASGNADYVLSPEEIALQINRIAQNLSKILEEKVDKTELEARKIIYLLKKRHKIDFSKYKATTFNRRIKRRIILGGFSNIGDYYEHLLRNPEELNELFQDLLINVTEFFRDPEAFRALTETVYSSIFEQIRENDEIRVWVVGCSTGEEAYSIAISIAEYMDDYRIAQPVKIFGTDINPESIRQARSGLYTDSITDNVSGERLRRFFIKREGGYELSKRIREMCIFAEHNVITDPPFSNMDLISCRNLLIYLELDTQQIVIPTFHYALKASGHLFLGKSETVGKYTDLFKLENSRYKIYSKKFAPPDKALFLPRYHVSESMRPESLETRHRSNLMNYLKAEADKLIMKEYAFPGVIVNEDFDIVQYIGNTGKYLTNPPGVPSTNLIKLTNPMIGLKLHQAIKNTRETGFKKRVEGIHIIEDSTPKLVEIEVSPLNTRRDNERYYLIVFIDKETIVSDTPKSLNDVEVEKLKAELKDTKDYLQRYMEEAEGYNEEMSSANEELQSSYEELQSINEELETTKEELQASNEELTTMNEELQSRNLELNQLYNDMNNLVNSVDIAIVIVDRDLRIQRATYEAKQLLNIRSSDVGRSINEIKMNVDIPELEDILLDTIEGLSTHDMELMDENGTWYNLKVRPYRTEGKLINGAVITLVDINAVKEGELTVLLLDSLVRNSQDVVIVLDSNDKIVRWNKSADTIYNPLDEKMVGKALSEVFPKDDFNELWEYVNRARRGEFIKLAEIGVNGLKDIQSLLVSVYPLEDESGLLQDLVIVQRAISKPKENQN